MDYESLCKLIDDVHGTPGFDTLCQRLILQNMEEYVKGLNRQYVEEELLPNGLIYFKARFNRLQIGDDDSKEPAWSLTFPTNIKDAFVLYEKNKEEIAKKSRQFAELYSYNIARCVTESGIFINNLKEDKQLIELKEKGYFDFEKINITRYYDVFAGRLDTKVNYENTTLHRLHTKLYVEFDEAEIKSEFKAARDKINNEFVDKAIADIIRIAKSTGCVTRKNQKALVNWAIDRQDYKLGKVIYSKRRKLYKFDRERIDSFMMSGQLAGIS